MKNLQRLFDYKHFLEGQAIGAVLAEDGTVLFNYLVPSNFSTEAKPGAYSHSKIWKAMLEMWPKQHINFVSLARHMQTLDQVDYLIKLSRYHVRSMNLSDALYLLELDIRLKIYNQLSTHKMQALQDKQAQDAGVMNQLQQNAIDLDEDFFAVMDDTHGFLLAQGLQEKCHGVLTLIEAIQPKALQIKKQAAFAAAKINFENQIRKHMTDPHQDAMLLLIAAVDALYKQTAEPELIDHILNMRVNEVC